LGQQGIEQTGFTSAARRRDDIESALLRHIITFNRNRCFGCSRDRRLVPERETVKRKTRKILESGRCKGGEFYQNAANKKTA
ncbi:hypothetical protein OFO87_32965, partial [Escherichia coli]|nr:hypothetical protein [Escherichia coli]